jgi:N-acetyl-anhydromuramyl-L-alanine amidase AmpD
MDIKWVGANINNFTSGRQGKSIKKIVVHWIVGTLESADATFNNPTRKASAHYGIGDDEIHQYVKESDTAWHAGDWNTNLESIGIEHEGGWEIDGGRLKPTQETHRTSSKLVREISNKYNIPLDREHIIGHNSVSSTSCPGSLDIDLIIKLAKESDMDTIEDLKKQIQALDEELDEMRLSRNEWRSKHKTLEERFETETSGYKEHIESLQKSMADMNMQLTTTTDQVKILSDEKSSLASRVEPLETKLQALIREVANLEGSLKSLSEKYNDVIVENSELKAKLKKKLKEFSLWDWLSSRW